MVTRGSWYYPEVHFVRTTVLSSSAQGDGHTAIQQYRSRVTQQRQGRFCATDRQKNPDMHGVTNDSKISCGCHLLLREMRSLLLCRGCELLLNLPTTSIRFAVQYVYSGRAGILRVPLLDGNTAAVSCLTFCFSHLVLM